MTRLIGTIAVLLIVPVGQAAEAVAAPVGATGTVGARADAKRVSRLLITRAGVYENFVVDGQGASGNLVKISADNVTVRNCEVRNGSGNGIGIFANKVTIENCRIHHMLASTFEAQHDAHGITGRWGDTLIRNCDISYTSGDSIQFDPDRASSGSARIEQCSLWTAPLTADVAGFKAGERPGENGVDTKTRPDGPRCRLFISDCYLHGWNQLGQIGNMAALNLKENVDAQVTRCVFSDNEIAFRVRGPGDRGGARVVIRDCAIYHSATGIRAENGIEVLDIEGLAWGEGVGQPIRFVGGEPAAGYRNRLERRAPELQALLKHGIPRRPD